MKITYLWIEKYHLFQNREFHLTDEFSFHYEKEKNCFYYQKKPGNLRLEMDDQVTDMSFIIGDNGQGKTTFLNLMMDLLGCSEDTYFISGEVVPSFLCVLQENSLYSTEEKLYLCHNIDTLDIHCKDTFEVLEDIPAKMESCLKEININKEPERFKELMQTTQMVHHSNSFEKNRYLYSAPRNHVTDLSFNGLLLDQEFASRLTEHANPLSLYCEMEMIRQIKLLTIMEKIDRQKEEMDVEISNIELPFRRPRRLNLQFLNENEIMTKALREMGYRANPTGKCTWHQTFAYVKTTSADSIHETYKPLVPFFSKKGKKCLLNLFDKYQKDIVWAAYAHIAQSVSIEFQKLYFNQECTMEEPVFYLTCQRILQSTLTQFYYHAPKKTAEIKKRMIQLRNYWVSVNNQTSMEEYLFQVISILLTQEIAELAVHEFLPLFVNLQAYEEDNHYYLAENIAPFFEKYLQVADGIHFIRFHWDGLSSGEDNLFSFYARINDMLSKAPEQVDSWIYFIDEADMTYHPEWQRKYMSALVEFLNSLYKVHNRAGDSIQLILATHSPIILSDALSGKVTYLSEHRDSLTNFFAANVYDIYRDGMFLQGSDYGIIGEYAVKKLEYILDLWDNKKVLSEEEQNRIQYLIDNIGDPLLQKMFYHRQKLENEKRKEKNS